MMQSMAITREILPGGAIKLSCDGCSFVYERLRPGAVRVTITGNDHGRFGTSTLDEIALCIQREGPIALFVDASAATGVAVEVSEAWRRFFEVNRAQLEQVHVLVLSEYVQLTVAIAQHLSRTGDLIRIHSSAASFEAALAGKVK